MQYLKHNWVREGKYITVKGQEGANMSHPAIPGLDVKHWISSDTEADYCLSVCPDDAIVQEVDPGLWILTEAEWDAIVATIPVPDVVPGMPGQPGSVGIEPPNWKTFKETALTSTSLNSFVASAFSTVPVAAAALPSTLLLIENGNYNDFAAVWSTIAGATTVPKALKTEFVTLATSCNLPQRFIDIFK